MDSLVEETQELIAESPSIDAIKPRKPYKRPKLKLACQNCRDRKVRCNGARPVCDSCGRKKNRMRHCVYSTQEAPEIWSDPRSPIQKSAESSNGRRESVCSHISTGLQNVTNDHVDLRAHEYDTSKTPSFLGTSSAVGFMEDARSTFQSWIDISTPSSLRLQFLDKPQHRNRSWFYTSGADEAGVENSSAEFPLPAKSTADSLVSNYFEVVHYELPVFSNPIFMERYNRLWTSPKTFEDQNLSNFDKKEKDLQSYKLFHCMLNLVFALGHEYHPEPGMLASSNSTQAAFFKRAKDLLSLDLIARPSLQLVQTLLLMVRYLQHRGLSEECWIIVGMAVRVAQGIGLQEDTIDESQALREEKRRVWCACIVLDRVQSLTFGRPLLLSVHVKMVLPQAIDDEYLCLSRGTADGRQPSHQSPKTAFFVWAIKLSNTIGTLLQSLYQPTKESDDNSVLKHNRIILEGDELLAEYRSKIPNYLCPESVAGNDFFSRQASLLKFRFLHLQIALFQRPIIYLAMKSSRGINSKSTILQKSFTAGCIDQCIAAIQELIELVKTHVGTSFLPPPWYTTFLIYTAGTLLVLILKVHSFRELYDVTKVSSIERSWSSCLDLLQKLHNIGESVAQRCTDTLLKVYEQAEVEEVRKSRSFLRSYKPENDTSNTLSTTTEAFQPEENDCSFREDSGPGGEEPSPDLWWTNTNLDWLTILNDNGKDLFDGLNDFPALY